MKKMTVSEQKKTNGGIAIGNINIGFSGIWVGGNSNQNPNVVAGYNSSGYNSTPQPTGTWIWKW